MPEGGNSGRRDAICHDSKKELPSSKRFIPILNYHQITDKDPRRDSYSVPTSKFERQMNYLHKHGYICLSSLDFLHLIRNDSKEKKKAFVLTFDDGYADFYKNAYPILKRFGFKATVFIVTDHVGRESSWEEEKRAPLLSWDEIKSLHKAGVSFGSHTCSHPDLTQISSEQILYELKASKEKLEAKLGEEIQLLAYPYGYSNNEIQRVARDVGYKSAFGVNTGRNGRFNLLRCKCLTNDNLLRFGFRLSPCYHYWRSLQRWGREEMNLGQFLRRMKL